MSLGNPPRALKSAPPYAPTAAVLRNVARGQGLLFRGRSGAPLLLLVLAAGAALPLAAYVRRGETSGVHARAAAAGVSALCCIAVIATAALVANERQAVWVYATEVTRRVAPYVAFFLVLMLVCTASIAAGRRPASRAVPRFFAAAALACYAVGFPWVRPLDTPFHLTADGRAVLAYLRDAPAPRDGFVLTNAVTTGEFHVYAERIGLLEGHQPLLRPRLLAQALERVEGARAFLRDPVAKTSFLLDHDVRYVVLQRGERTDVGGRSLVGADELASFSARSEDAGLEPVFRAGAVDVYRVARPSTVTPVPRRE